MKVCFPVVKAEGLDSKVYGHFGSAPVFIVVETHDNNITSINNRNQHHAHGACNPLKALDSQRVDAIIVGGIGAGALSRLQQSGIKVFQAQASTVRENIALFIAQSLPEIALQHCCPGHGHISGCKH